MSVIATIDQLEAIYGQPNEASTVKVADRITPPYRVLIDKSPFAALATCGPEGLDCSPRGDLPGFVRVHDEKTLMMPDRRGNNRVDSIGNILQHPRIGLIFFVPGIRETLRVNGRAQITTDPVLLGPTTVNGKPPRSGSPCGHELSAPKRFSRSASTSGERPCSRRSAASCARVQCRPITSVRSFSAS